MALCRGHSSAQVARCNISKVIADWAIARTISLISHLRMPEEGSDVRGGNCAVRMSRMPVLASVNWSVSMSVWMPKENVRCPMVTAMDWAGQMTVTETANWGGTRPGAYGGSCGLGMAALHMRHERTTPHNPITPTHAKCFPVAYRLRMLVDCRRGG